MTSAPPWPTLNKAERETAESGPWAPVSDGARRGKASKFVWGQRWVLKFSRFLHYKLPNLE